MSDISDIEWLATTHADGKVTPGASWNPVAGCERVSDGCTGCYAEGIAARFSGPGLWAEGLARWKVKADGKREPRWTGVVRTVPAKLADPLRWRRPRRVFVNSMSDLFHKDVPNEYIAAVFGVMAATPRHTFLILTKRADRLPKWFEWLRTETRGYWHGEHGRLWDALASVAPSVGTPEAWKAMYQAAHGSEPATALGDVGAAFRWPLPNVHLGISAEDQTTADERIPCLLSAPAAVRWVSAEPLLGPIDLNRIDATKAGWRSVNGFPQPTAISAFGKWQETPMRARLQNGIDWLVVGSESGPRARPMDTEWARAIRYQCAAAAVPLFTKQIATVEGRRHGNPKGGDPQWWPDGPWPRDYPR